MEWIEIAEKIHPLYKRVLVVADKKTYIGYAYYLEGKFDWSVTDIELCAVHSYTVTHWMPLPPFPL